MSALTNAPVTMATKRVLDEGLEAKNEEPIVKQIKMEIPEAAVGEAHEWHEPIPPTHHVGLHRGGRERGVARSHPTLTVDHHHGNRLLNQSEACRGAGVVTGLSSVTGRDQWVLTDRNIVFIVWRGSYSDLCIYCDLSFTKYKSTNSEYGDK